MWGSKENIADVENDPDIKVSYYLCNSMKALHTTTEKGKKLLIFTGRNCYQIFFFINIVTQKNIRHITFNCFV